MILAIQPLLGVLYNHSQLDLELLMRWVERYG